MKSHTLAPALTLHTGSQPKIGCCACCGTPILMGETHLVTLDGRKWCKDHRPSLAQQFVDVMAALDDPHHKIWNDVDAVIDAFLDADTLRRQITGSELSLVPSTQPYSEFAQGLIGTPVRDDWIYAFGEEYWQLKVFCSHLKTDLSQ